MAKETQGQWQMGETYSTHSHPTRFWQTAIFSGNDIVAYACGASEEESQANALVIVQNSKMLQSLVGHVLT